MAMTKEEYVRMRLADDRKMYRGIEITWVIAAFACVIMGVVGFFLRGPHALMLGVGAFGCVLSASNSHQKVSSFDDADAEIAKYGTYDPDYEGFSAYTRGLLRDALMPANLLTQMSVAYGVCAAMLYAGAGVLVWLSEDSVALLALGALLGFGGVLLTILTYKALRSRKLRLTLDIEE